MPLIASEAQRNTLMAFHATMSRREAKSTDDHALMLLVAILAQSLQPLPVETPSLVQAEQAEQIAQSRRQLDAVLARAGILARGLLGEQHGRLVQSGKQYAVVPVADLRALQEALG